MLEHKAIPPQASHKVWNPKIPDPSRHRMTLSKSLKTWDAPMRAAMINSYGAAGSNAAVLCCEAPEQPRPDRHSLTENRHVKQPIILSAASVSSLRRYQNLLAKYIAKTTPQPNIEEIAYTLSERRQRHKNFIVFEASNTAELIEMRLGDVKGQTPAPEREISPRKPLVLVFGGQSKQTIGLCKDIYERFFTFRTHVDRCDTILQQLGYPSILPAIFQTGSKITDMVVLQTGFVAVQYAAAATWVDASLQIDAVIGHSLGELTALAISGKLSIHDLTASSWLRRAQH
ncbi:Beta-ketoacyl synthase [Metarhizium anisopliae]